MSEVTNAVGTAVGNVREWVTRQASRPYGYLSGEWERLGPRERRLITTLAVAVLVLTLALGAILTFSRISELQEGNAEIREALAAIGKHRDEYLDAKARNAVQEARIGNDPPQLTGDLEAAARGENIQIAESSERPAAPAGRRYLVHDVDLKLREVDLQSLTRFLRRVETGPRLIVVTRISIKRRFSETDKLDVELTATAFERVKESKKKAETAGKGGGGVKPEPADTKGAR